MLMIFEKMLSFFFGTIEQMNKTIYHQIQQIRFLQESCPLWNHFESGLGYGGLNVKVWPPDSNVWIGKQGVIFRNILNRIILNLLK